MCSTPVEVPAVARARWLAEVAETLEQAEHLVNRLKLIDKQPAMIGELELRIEAAKREVDSLRISRPQRSESDPRWINFAPWEQAGPNSA